MPEHAHPQHAHQRARSYDVTAPPPRAPRERTPDEMATTAKTIADNLERAHGLATEGLAAMVNAAAIEDRAAYDAGRKRAIDGISQITAALGHARTHEPHAADEQIRQRLANAENARKALQDQLDAAPPAPEIKAPVLSSEASLRAALPPDEPVGDAWRRFAEWERAVKAVIVSEMTASDIAALARIRKEHPDHELSRRFRRFGGERLKGIEALLASHKVRAMARAREDAQRRAEAVAVAPPPGYTARPVEAAARMTPATIDAPPSYEETRGTIDIDQARENREAREGGGAGAAGAAVPAHAGAVPATIDAPPSYEETRGTIDIDQARENREARERAAGGGAEVAAYAGPVPATIDAPPSYEETRGTIDVKIAGDTGPRRTRSRDRAGRAGAVAAEPHAPPDVAPEDAASPSTVASSPAAASSPAPTGGERGAAGRSQTERASESAALARGLVETLRAVHLPVLRVMLAAHDQDRAREAAASARYALARADVELRGARHDLARIVGLVDRARLTVEIDAIEADLAALRPEAEQVLREAPAEHEPEALLVDAPPPGERCEPAEQASEPAIAVAGGESVNAEHDLGLAHELGPACYVGLPRVAADAVRGIHLWLQFDMFEYGKIDQSPPPYQFGPDRAGAYRIRPYTRRGELLFFIASHVERDQREWVIGPDSVGDFAGQVAFYQGAAARFYPGSEHVPGSQADGADRVEDPESVLELQARGAAPWQRQPGSDGTHDGIADKLNGGGTALLAARNANIRLTHYVEAAERMSRQIAAELAAGDIDHMSAREQAVAGRTQLLDDTRARQTFGARTASQAIKGESKTLAEMADKKVGDLLRDYTVSYETRAILDRDSELWGKYAKVMTEGQAAMEAARRDLGNSPEVSRAIIGSSGKTNKTVTRIARFAEPAGMIVGGIGALEMILDIRDAAEADAWHAVAGELAGFAGGVIGGEVAAGGGAWVASLVPALSRSAGAVLVVSFASGVFGGFFGSLAATTLVDRLVHLAMGVGQRPAPGGAATTFAAAGGLAGIHSKDHPSGYPVAKQIMASIAETDEELARIASAIRAARSREELETLHRFRLKTLARRQDMETMLTAIRLSELADPPTACEPSATVDAGADDVPALDELAVECAVDQDCDMENG